MYPYVNRLPHNNLTLGDKKFSIEVPQKDSNGLPIHGFYTQTPRKIVQKAENILEMTTIDTYKPNDVHFPNFCEKFILVEDRLRVENVFEGDETKEYPLYFAYGYHPFFTLDNRKIDELIVKTNMHYNVELDPKTLLPVIKDNKLVYTPIEA